MPSIWIENPPQGLKTTERRVRALWPLYEDEGRAVRAAPHLVRPWLSTSSVARLQNFVQKLIGELRYQTCELFLAPPYQGHKQPRTPALVAAAFRKTDNYKKRLKETDKPTGVYSLSDSKFEELRRVATCGEPIDVLTKRIQRFQEGLAKDDELTRHVKYAAMGTVVAYLARQVPDEHGHVGMSLWSLAKDALGRRIPEHARGARRQGLPGTDVRTALAALVAAQGDLLLENGPSDGLVERVYDRSLESALKASPRREHLDQAFELWSCLSEQMDTFAQFLRSQAQFLHIAPLRLLFEAQIRAYPDWLSSATMGVEQVGYPVVYGDLRVLLAQGDGRRNQHVNVASLEGYERAAGNFLIDSRVPRGGRHPVLKSMMLIPLDFREGARYSGFLRFMNRFESTDDKQRIYSYQVDREKPGVLRWRSSEEEEQLGISIFKLAREFLPTLLPGGEPGNLGDGGGSPTMRFTPDGDSKLIGRSAVIEQVREKVRRAAVHDDPVLILGPPGSGKGVVAEEIHRLSKRGKHHFQAINVPAIQENVFEAELFGHKKGGFTTALEDRLGLVRATDKGTLLFDEIGDLPQDRQVKLLRLIENREVKPVGSDETAQVDVRMIFATNRDLDEALANGSFRSDLYYRISIDLIYMPALADRSEDILPLLQHLLTERPGGDEIRFTDDGRDALLRHRWGGNVRELKNFAHRVANHHTGQTLDHESVTGLLRSR